MSQSSQSEEEVFIEQENITRITEEEEVNLVSQTVGPRNNSLLTKQHTSRLTSSKFGTNNNNNNNTTPTCKAP